MSKRRLTKQEEYLVEQARETGRSKSPDAFARFLRGFRQATQTSESQALKSAFDDLLEEHRTLYD
jgi:hypothetical protein